MKKAEGRKGLGASRDFLISAFFILPSAFGLPLLPSAFQQDGLAFVGERPLDAPQLGPQTEDPASDFAQTEGGLELGDPQRRGDRLFEAGEEDRFAALLAVHAVQRAEDGFDDLVAAVNGHLFLAASRADCRWWRSVFFWHSFIRAFYEAETRPEWNRSKQREQRLHRIRFSVCSVSSCKLFGPSFFH